MRDEFREVFLVDRISVTDPDRSTVRTAANTTFKSPRAFVSLLETIKATVTDCTMTCN